LWPEARSAGPNAWTVREISSLTTEQVIASKASTQPRGRRNPVARMAPQG